MKFKLKPKSFSRYTAIQAIYNYDFSEDFDKVENYFLINDDFKIYFDFKIDVNKSRYNKEFLSDILKTFSKEKNIIDDLIITNLGKGWTLDRLPKVLLAILRAAVSEIIISKNTSIAVIVSEYIMFTDSFFTNKECSFTNAILEKIFKKLKNE